MDARSRTEAAIQDIERRIQAILGQATELERALANVLTTNTDPDLADEALRSTYHALGLYQRRRDMLQRDLAAQAEEAHGASLPTQPAQPTPP